MKRLLLPLVFVSVSALAADLPKLPSKPIAVKKELLFSDDFQTAQAAVWKKVVPTFAVVDGVLKGTQTRDKEMPSPDGKSVIKAHAAVHGLEIPTKDSIIECKIRFDGATMIDFELDDRNYTGCHYGHICRAQIRLNGVTIIDEKDGNMRNDIYAMKKDPAKKAEVAKLLVGRQITYPAKLESGKWYTIGVELAGDEMRVTIDGKVAAYLKSSGIAHPTKSRFEFGVAGKDGCYDELKIWNAASAVK